MAKARIIVSVRDFKPVTLDLTSETYVIGRAENASEFGHGQEVDIRYEVVKEINDNNENEAKSIIKRHIEQTGLPFVYIIKHLIHKNKITFAPYLTNVSRRLGILAWYEEMKKYIL